MFNVCDIRCLSKKKVAVKCNSKNIGNLILNFITEMISFTLAGISKK